MHKIPVVETHMNILEQWIKSCTRNNKISRNTVAVGIVVLDHLSNTCPALKDDVITGGGEVKGTRSGLSSILEKYGLPASFLKEVTTRQGHQDGQKLFDLFNWGDSFIDFTDDDRKTILQALINRLCGVAIDWLRRQKLKLNIDRRQSPSAWIHSIIKNAEGDSGGIVEQHLVGAKLERRFSDIHISNHPAHAGDSQTSRSGDFGISNIVYHVTGSPTSKVIEKCIDNIRAGLHPILIVPLERESNARALAIDKSMDTQITIISIESFLAINIIEIATEKQQDFYCIMKDIIDLYNKRLMEVETDLSLQIEIQ